MIQDDNLKSCPTRRHCLRHGCKDLADGFFVFITPRWLNSGFCIRLVSKELREVHLAGWSSTMKFGTGHEERVRKN